jgi:hypothetical protein
MPSLPDPVKKGAGVAVGALHSAAGRLRGVAGGEQQPQPPQPEEPQRREEEQPDAQASEPAAPAERAPAPGARGHKPAAATRQSIASPKAAKKVRARKK